VHHGSSLLEKEQLTKVIHADQSVNGGAMRSSHFPEAVRQALQTSHRLLADGLGALFTREHQELVTPAIRFLEKRIGGDHLVSGAEE
jgi:hypothetical protein